MSHWDDFGDDHPRFKKVLSNIQRYLPPLNFYTIHYAYFIIVCLITSVIFWGSSTPEFRVSYTDSLFLVVSAMTDAGLNTVNLSQITTWQQVLLWLLIMLGSTIWVSIWTILARKHVFEKRFDDIVRAERIRSLKRTNSTISLGIKRFTSFRKAQTVATPDTVLPGTGSRALGPPTPRPEVGNDRVQNEDGRLSPRRRASMSDLHNLPRTENDQSKHDSSAQPPASPAAHITFVRSPRPNVSGSTSSTATSYLPENRSTRRNGTAKESTDHGKTDLGMQNFLTDRTVGRNGQFHDLTREEREHLGGCEYRALKALAVIVPIYFVAWQLLGCVALGAWINNYQPEAAIGNGINPWWAGIFNGVSAFNNSGMSLIDANMIPFQNAHFVLIAMGLMVLAGNTAYPLFLRLILWSVLKVLKFGTAEESFRDWKATLEFILKYPRRVYTNLFPSRPTWWLLFMLVLLNSIDWVCFELLNLGNPVIEGIPTGSRILDGLFQALAVRSGGFYVVPISSVYIGLQLLYVIMMYISVYPVVITMRHSNVYEERSLGIYGNETKATTDDLENAAQGYPQAPTYRTSITSRPAIIRRLSKSGTASDLRRFTKAIFGAWQGVGVPPPPSPEGESRISFISQQIHGQLAHDIWWLVLTVLVITTIETSHFMGDPITYSVFNIIFEVVSAYGCVGISVGLPTAAYSFCGGWRTASKLVLCLVMLRGRHRGLPVALDRAVRLPGEQLHHDEEEDHRIRRSMTNRRASFDAKTV